MKLNVDKFDKIIKETFLYYQYRLGYINKENKYKFNYTEAMASYNFSKYTKTFKKEKINIDWLFDFFNFQFTHWSYVKDLKEKNENKIVKIQLHWIVGEKAINRYNQRTKANSYFYHSVFLPKYQIQKEDVEKYLRKKDLLLEEKDKSGNILVINPLIDVEERRKKVRFNTIEGFYNCIDSTSLFKFISPICSECSFKEKCKILLENRYPNIYNQRLLNYNNNVHK